MGPHNEVNSVLGSSFALLSKTAGNLHSGKTTFSGLGSTIQYNSLCIAENEEALPAGWDPIHVQMGFKPTDSVLSVATGWSYISSVGEVQRGYPPQYLMRDYMRSLSGMGACVIMAPEVAGSSQGFAGFQHKARPCHMAGEQRRENRRLLLGQWRCFHDVGFHGHSGS